MIRLAGKGNWSPRGDPGDLQIRIKIKPHSFYQRDGSDIIVTRHISLSQAILGAKIQVDTLWSTHEVQMKPGTRDGAQHVLRGQGINKLPPEENQRGDHRIKFKLHVPTEITNE